MRGHGQPIRRLTLAALSALCVLGCVEPLDAPSDELDYELCSAPTYSRFFTTTGHANGTSVVVRDLELGRATRLASTSPETDLLRLEGETEDAFYRVEIANFGVAEAGTFPLVNASSGSHEGVFMRIELAREDLGRREFEAIGGTVSFFMVRDDEISGWFDGEFGSPENTFVGCFHFDVRADTGTN